MDAWNNSTGRPCWPRWYHLKKDGSVNLSWSLASYIKTAGSFFFLIILMILDCVHAYCCLSFHNTAHFEVFFVMKWAVHHAMQGPGSRVWFSALYFCHVHNNESAIHPVPFKSSLGPIFHLHGVPQFVSAYKVIPHYSNREDTIHYVWQLPAWFAVKHVSHFHLCFSLSFCSPSSHPGDRKLSEI